MSKKLQKSLRDYLSKIKSTSQNIQFPSKTVSSSRKWILRRCRHPKLALSFSINPASKHGGKGTSSDGNNNDAATLADIDRFLFENFKSLYIEEDDEVEERRCNHGGDHMVKSSDAFSPDSPRFMDREPPVYDCGSNRFFVTTGVSSSFIEEARSSAGTSSTMSISENTGSTSTSSTSINNTVASNDFNSDDGVRGDGVQNECIAVLTCSHNPHDDFLRSMQEMVEARLKHHSNMDWDFMQELLLCYLKLNDKKSHKFILSAFVDLVADLRRNDMKVPDKSRHFEVNNVREHTKSRRTRHHVW